MDFNELIRSISFNTFSEVIEISPRKVRESLYSHYGVKTKSRNVLVSLKDKKEQKYKQLHEALQKAKNEKEQNFLKELFRNWLFHKRPLLKETLDFLGVPNDNGLIEQEPDFFKALSKEKISSLINHLKPKFPTDEILIYLTFMEVPRIKEYLF
jgi:hypothetical protein